MGIIVYSVYAIIAEIFAKLERRRTLLKENILFGNGIQ